MAALSARQANKDLSDLIDKKVILKGLDIGSLIREFLSAIQATAKSV